MKKLISGILALSMFLCVTGCTDTTWVAQKGETVVTNGMYKGMLVNAYRQGSLTVTDSSVPLEKQQIDGKNFYDWVKEQALRDLQMYYGVTQKCDELGIDLEQERIDSLTKSVEENWAQLEIFDKNGCDTQSYTALNLYSHKSNMLFEKTYGQGGQKQVSEQEILDYYQSQYARIKLIAMPKTSPDNNLFNQEGESLLVARANSYLARLQNGESIDDLIKENDNYYKTDKQQEQQEQNPDDNYYVISKDEAQIPKEFVDKFFEISKVGVPELYDVEDYIIIAIRYDLDTSEETMASFNNSLLWGIKGAEFEQEIIDLSGDIVINEAAVKKISPKKIKM